MFLQKGCFQGPHHLKDTLREGSPLWQWKLSYSCIAASIGVCSFQYLCVHCRFAFHRVLLNPAGSWGRSLEWHGLENVFACVRVMGEAVRVAPVTLWHKLTGLSRSVLSGRRLPSEVRCTESISSQQDICSDQIYRRFFSQLLLSMLACILDDNVSCTPQLRSVLTRHKSKARSIDRFWRGDD